MLATNAARRVLLVGLDAMEWTLVEKWSAEGTLPALTGEAMYTDGSSIPKRKPPPGGEV
jgi:hypothetical protein